MYMEWFIHWPTNLFERLYKQRLGLGWVLKPPDSLFAYKLYVILFIAKFSKNMSDKKAISTMEGPALVLCQCLLSLAGSGLLFQNLLHLFYLMFYEWSEHQLSDKAPVLQLVETVICSKTF